MGAGQASLRRPKGIDDTRQAPRLELTLSLQGGGEKHASFKGQAAAAASSRPVAAPSWRPGHPAPLPRTRTDGDGPGRRQDCAPPPAQRAAARNSSINRSKLPGKIFASQTEAPPPSASANKYRPRGGGGGSAAASREAPRGSQVPGKGRLFVRPAGARPPSAHGPAPCAPPRPPPRSPPPASEASPRRRPSRPSSRLLRAALRAPAPSRAPPRPPRASFAAPRAGRRTERGGGGGGGPPGPWAHRGPGSAAPPPGTKPGPPVGPCVVQGPRHHPPPTWRGKPRSAASEFPDPPGPPGPGGGRRPRLPRSPFARSPAALPQRAVPAREASPPPGLGRQRSEWGTDGRSRARSCQPRRKVLRTNPNPRRADRAWAKEGDRDRRSGRWDSGSLSKGLWPRQIGGPLLTAPSEGSLSAFRFPAAPSVAPATRGSSQQGSVQLCFLPVFFLSRVKEADGLSCALRLSDGQLTGLETLTSGITWVEAKPG
ncbi:uncharacterized protein LOC132676700 [Panthera onca]